MLIEAKTFYKRVQAVNSIFDIPEDVERWFIFHGKTGRLFVCPKPLNHLADGWYLVTDNHIPVYEFDGDGRVSKFVGCSCGANVVKDIGYDPNASIGEGELQDRVVDVEIFHDHYAVGNAYITLEEIDGDVYVFATRKDDEKMREAVIRFRKDYKRFIRCNSIENDYGIRLDEDALYWMKCLSVPSKKEPSRRVKMLAKNSPVALGMARGEDDSVDIFISDGNGSPLDYLMNISPRGMMMYPFNDRWGFLHSPVSGMNVLAHTRCRVDTGLFELGDHPQG